MCRVYRIIRLKWGSEQEMSAELNAALKTFDKEVSGYAATVKRTLLSDSEEIVLLASVLDPVGDR